MIKKRTDQMVLPSALLSYDKFKQTKH